MTQEPTLKVPTSTSSVRQVNQATVVQQAVVQESQDDKNIHQFQNSLKSQQRLKELEAEVQHYESLVRELKKQMSISGMMFHVTEVPYRCWLGVALIEPGSQSATGKYH